MSGPTAAGTYFDGRSARPHPVELRLTDQLAITGEGIALAWDLFAVRTAGAVPPLTRLRRAGDPALVEFSDEAFAASLRAACPDFEQEEKAEGGGRLRLVLWSVAAGLSVLLVAIFGVPAVAVRLAPLVPSGLEARLGAVVDGEIVRLLDEPPECSHAPARAVLDRLVQRLAQGRDLPAEIRVSVRKHDMANALTLPGGRVIVLSGLIERSKSADEFAGVLAHELGHVAARDPMRSLIAASGTSFLLSLVLGDLTGSTIIVAAGQAAISAGYSRDAERAADDYAVATMTGAGGRGEALASVLERIAGNEKREGASDFLRSHPFTDERAKRIRAQAGAESEQARILDDADWAVLKGICRGAEKR